MDSIKVLSLDNHNYQRLHSKAPHSGHLHKGHSRVSNSATIPSKYETYVVENSEKKGFNNSSKRFDYEINENICPGVGSYTGTTEFLQNTPSYSKHGTGSFASKNKFVSHNSFADNPAPNFYELPSVDSKSNFSKSPVSRLFHQNIAVKIDNKTSKLPAPNSYTLPSTIGDSNVNQPLSSFKSNTTRDLNVLNDKMKQPGPGQYTISKADNILSTNSTLVQSPFKSTSKRNFIKKYDGPGPTDYNINGENSQKLPMDPKFIRRHYLCLAASALKLPPTPPQPGPGQYNVSKNLSEPYHFMSSSMFTSNSSRWTKAGVNIGIGISQGQSGGNNEHPGPANYQPVKPKKQSFHYNVSNIWV